LYPQKFAVLPFPDEKTLPLSEYRPLKDAPIGPESRQVENPKN